MVLLGRSVALPCVNRRPLWRDGLQEDQQQVAHWDYQAPGVRQDRADRLVDLYASGERREYGPVFTPGKMSLEEDAFSDGDFSLSIVHLEPEDRGLYSCHLHHHYCGVYERRIFRLTVGPPRRRTPTAPSPPPPPPPAPPVPTSAPRVPARAEPDFSKERGLYAVPTGTQTGSNRRNIKEKYRNVLKWKMSPKRWRASGETTWCV